jgi:hypothetical protein
VAAEWAELENCTFSGSRSTRFGGGLWTNNLVALQSSFVSCQTRYGGGAWVGAMANLTAVTFVNCSAEESGGISAATLVARDTAFLSCWANVTAGGGAGVQGLADLTNSTFFDCSLAGLFCSILKASHCTFRNCSGIYGGCAAVTSAYLTGCVFDSCRAGMRHFLSDPDSEGGGLSAVNVTAVNTSFLRCQAGAGGGFMSQTSATLRDCLFEGCFTREDGYGKGGGAWSRGTLEASGTLFQSCHSGNEGGGVAAVYANLLDVNFTNCSGSSGGGLLADGFKATRCRFLGCQAVNNGGAALATDAELLDTALSNCSANSGGCLVVSNFRANRTAFQDCFAPSGAGGARVWGSANLSDVSFQRCTSISNSNVRLNISGCSLDH